jgi:uncharacterized membrane protein
VIGLRPGGGAFLWERGTTQVLPLDGAVAINDAGRVVGWVAQRAAVWESGTLTELGTLRSDGGGFSQAVAVSKRGSVFGTMSTDVRGQYPNATDVASFRWSDGQLDDLGTPAAGNQPQFFTQFGDDQRVVAADAEQGQAAVWENGAWTLFFGPSHSVYATDMSGNGTIVGSDGSRGAGRAFAWQNGVAQYLGTDPCSRAEAINDADVVAGWTGQCFGSLEQAAAIWMPVTRGGPTIAAGVP